MTWGKKKPDSKQEAVCNTARLQTEEEKWLAVGQFFVKTTRKHTSTHMIDISSAGIS